MILLLAAIQIEIEWAKLSADRRLKYIDLYSILNFTSYSIYSYSLVFNLFYSILFGCKLNYSNNVRLQITNYYLQQQREREKKT